MSGRGDGTDREDLEKRIREIAAVLPRRPDAFRADSLGNVYLQPLVVGYSETACDGGPRFRNLRWEMKLFPLGAVPEARAPASGRPPTGKPFVLARDFLLLRACGSGFHDASICVAAFELDGRVVGGLHGRACLETWRRTNRQGVRRRWWEIAARAAWRVLHGTARADRVAEQELDDADPPPSDFDQVWQSEQDREPLTADAPTPDERASFVQAEKERARLFLAVMRRVPSTRSAIKQSLARLADTISVPPVAPNGRERLVAEGDRLELERSALPNWMLDGSEADTMVLRVPGIAAPRPHRCALRCGADGMPDEHGHCCGCGAVVTGPAVRDFEAPDELYFWCGNARCLRRYWRRFRDGEARWVRLQLKVRLAKRIMRVLGLADSDVTTHWTEPRHCEIPVDVRFLPPAVLPSP